MQYQLEIKQDNIKPHLDLENDLQARKEGLFTFTLRISNGVIVDYNIVEYVNARTKYLQLKQVVIEEYTTAFDYRERGQADAIRTDNV